MAGDLQFMQMQPMRQQQNPMQDFGMKMLQSALAQRQQGQAAMGPQPGQAMPGLGGAPGPMNILPQQQPVGLLQKLLGGFFGPGGTAPPAPPAAPMGGGAANMGGLGPLV